MKKTLILSLMLALVLTGCKTDGDIDFNVPTPDGTQNSVGTDKDQNSVGTDESQDSSTGDVDIDSTIQDDQGSSDNSGEDIEKITFMTPMGEVPEEDYVYVENGEIKVGEWGYFEAYYPTQDPSGGLTFIFNYAQKYGVTHIENMEPMRYLSGISHFSQEPDLFFIRYGNIRVHLVVANIKSQTFEEIPEHEAWREKNISRVILLPDSSLMFVSTNDNGYTSSYFYDGQNAVDIDMLLAEVTNIKFTYIVPYYQNSKVVLCCTYTGGVDSVLYTFEYNSEKQKLIPCLENLTYDDSSNSLSEGIALTESGYGICLRQSQLTIIDLLTGREENTGIPSKAIKWSKDIGDGMLLVAASDDSLTVYDMKMGRVMTKAFISKIQGARLYLDRIPSDEGLYISISSEDGGTVKYIYKLLEE